MIPGDSCTPQGCSHSVHLSKLGPCRPTAEAASACRCDSAHLIHELPKVGNTVRAIQGALEHLLEQAHAEVLVDGVGCGQPYCIGHLWQDLRGSHGFIRFMCHHHRRT